MTSDASDPLNELYLQPTTDPLANYSARDLFKAIHHTSKDDLKQCVEDPRRINESWERLVNADRSLRYFYDFELAKIIKLYHQRKNSNNRKTATNQR